MVCPMWTIKEMPEYCDLKKLIRVLHYCKKQTSAYGTENTYIHMHAKFHFAFYKPFKTQAYKISS